MKKKVLLVSFTNQAIDNVLIRLKDSGFENYIRLASSISQVNEKVQDKVKVHKMIENME